MAEMRAYYTGADKACARKHSATRFFELTVLRNSLHDIHRHVLEAITLLETFFATYSAIVEQQSTFSFRRTLTAFTSQNVTFSGMDEEGNQGPMTLTDHLEHELNVGIRSQDLVMRFGTVLGMCASLSHSYRRLTTMTSPKAYQALPDCLRLVREVQTENQPLF
ncbi:MAG: hypothetical protein EOO62_27225 [Hymenobacter sp.]|nr:MAG: hypothetical protein EOO62_27225 [Hymenobacter sp.]